MAKKTLTVALIEKTNPPKEGRIEIVDTVVPGLTLRISQTGAKSFSIAYKVRGEGGMTKTGRLRRGKQHRIFLGDWPGMKLAAARDKARKHLEEVSEDRDPRVKLRKDNTTRHDNTVEVVAGRFIQNAKLSVASWQKAERSLRLHVIPTLGGLLMTDIRRRDIHDLLDDMVAQECIGAAREVRKHLHKMFRWAVDREIVTGNPVNGMIRDELAPNGDAGRALTDEELRAIWSAAGSLGYPFGPWFRVLMLTGQRRNDWADAQRSEIDAQGRTLEIPAARFKSDRDHIVPLPDPVWEIVQSLPVFEGDYLFSSRNGDRPISGFSKAKKRMGTLIVKAAMTPWRVHDLRVTCKTRFAALGIKPEVSDAVVGHKRQGLAAIYNKHEYIEEKREALDTYASHLMEVVG